MHKLIFSISALLLISGCKTKKSLLPATLSQKSFPNVEIAAQTGGVGPCEPSIAINPSNPNQVIGASILDRVHVSNDGGKTWQNSKVKSTFGVYGDPVICFGQENEVYFAHLSNPKNKAYASQEFLDRIVIQKSTDGGKNWNNGSWPEADKKKDHDKHWLAVDPNTNDLIVTWTQFDKYGSTDDNDKSNILFARSADQGDSWSKAIAINEISGDCLDGDNTTEGAVPAVGVNGEYMVAWSVNNKIYFDISTDKGKTWLAQDRLVAEQPGGWTFDIPGLGRCNGMPITVVDHSNGPNRGTIYVNWGDQRNGTNDTDIWLASSSDNGASWTKPKRVNNDEAGKHQFLSWMDVDPLTGYIYVVFYDRRNHSDTMTDVFLAYSMDGGNTFENIKISESPFETKNITFFGDYNDISTYGGIIRPIWTRQEEMRLSVMTALINHK